MSTISTRTAIHEDFRNSARVMFSRGAVLFVAASFLTLSMLAGCGAKNTTPDDASLMNAEALVLQYRGEDVKVKVPTGATTQAQNIAYEEKTVTVLLSPEDIDKIVEDKVIGKEAVGAVALNDFVKRKGDKTDPCTDCYDRPGTKTTKEKTVKIVSIKKGDKPNEDGDYPLDVTVKVPVVKETTAPQVREDVVVLGAVPNQTFWTRPNGIYNLDKPTPLSQVTKAKLTFTGEGSLISQIGKLFKATFGVDLLFHHGLKSDTTNITNDNDNCQQQYQDQQQQQKITGDRPSGHKSRRQPECNY